jgi:hypothetical protein
MFLYILIRFTWFLIFRLRLLLCGHFISGSLWRKYLSRSIGIGHILGIGFYIVVSTYYTHNIFLQLFQILKFYKFF